MKRRWFRHGLLWLFRIYPPYLGSGIKVVRLSHDFRACEVELKLRWYNRNYVGTHFGGSLYSMCDPFFMLLLMENLGRDYIVWDKAASIRFVKPGRGVVRASFRLSQRQIRSICQKARTKGKTEPVFTVTVRDESGQTVAEVQKTIYVRYKHFKAAKAAKLRNQPRS